MKQIDWRNLIAHYQPHIERSSLAITALLLFSVLTTASAVGVADMTWQRRVIVMSAGNPDEPRFQQQRQLIMAWPGGEERDVTVVSVAGDKVTGSSDDAALLRRHFQLPAESFMVVLVGKDGHVALRSRVPVSGETFERTIDAMPMRQAGER